MAERRANRSRLATFLWGAAAVLALLLGVKYFVADLYRITSGSMRPTLMGGPAPDGGPSTDEWVLVRYDRAPELERFDLVVVDRDGRDPVVKRVVGLPGESLRIVEGDLLIDGRRLPPEAPRPPWIPVFDDRLHEVREHFRMASAEGEPWSEHDGTWELDSLAIDQGRDSGRSSGVMFYGPDVRDDYLDPAGRRVVGKKSVGDVLLACELRLDVLRGQLRFQLTEAGDTFEARISPDPAAQAGAEGIACLVELSRSNAQLQADPDPALRRRVRDRTRVALPSGRWLRVQLSNADNHVRFRLPDLDVDLGFSYEANARFPGKTPFGDQNVGSRVSLGGEGLRAGFRAMRVARDLHYTSVPERGGFGVGTPASTSHAEVFLGPDEVFLLGDNSVYSNDSRHVGPFSTAEIAGRPVLVVWPPDRLRVPAGAAPR